MKLFQELRIRFRLFVRVVREEDFPIEQDAL
jgi:hypothetical protein